MRARHTTRIWMLLVMALLLPFAASCSSDDDPTGLAADALVGTWQVRSFQAAGMDFIAQGMTMRITLSAGKTYSVVVTDDLIGTCGQATDCTDTGSYSSTTTQITMDPGTADETTFNYSIQGTTMTFTGSIDNIPVTIVLRKS